jgi:hypothetical protein
MSAQPDITLGETAVCGPCAAVYLVAEGHGCRGPLLRLLDGDAVAPLAPEAWTLPDGTPHPYNPAWAVAGGIWQYTGGDAA